MYNSSPDETIGYFWIRLGSEAFNIGSIDSGEDSFGMNTSFSPEQARNSLIVKAAEPLQGGQEPAYWGVTFPSRIEALFSTPHNAPISRSVSKDESIRSLLDDEGKKIDIFSV